MANSIRDQFLKAGLVNKQQTQKATQEKRRARKANPGKKGQTASTVQPDAAAAARIARDRELNRQIVEQRKQAELAAQVRQLVQRHRLEREDADVAFNFQHGSAIRNIYVTPKIQAALAAGTVAIIALGDDTYDLVPLPIADRIRERDASFVLDGTGTADAEPDPDDPYRDYVVPDDLTW